MSSNTALTINPEVKIVGVTTPVTVKLSNPHGVRRISAYIEQGGARYPLYRSQDARPPLVLAAAPAVADADLRRRQEQGAESEGRRRAHRGGGRCRRFRGPYRFRIGRREGGAGAAARGSRRRAALHQSGRHGTGRDDSRRIVERSGREGRQVHLPQFPPAGPPRAALLHVRVSLGPAAGQPDARGVRAQSRPARKPRPSSGSSCFRRSSAYAIFRSTTR